MKFDKDEYEIKKGELERKIYNLNFLIETFINKEGYDASPFMQVAGDLMEDIYQISVSVLQSNTTEEHT